jgi:Cu+-exporting ATPase
MAQAPLASGTAPASGSSCPGCGKPVDPLRAGHVAVFDGVFLYYCDQRCKAVHLRAIAASLEDAVTLDPPAVMERLAPASHERAMTSPAASTAPPPPVEPRASAPPASFERDRRGEEEEEEAPAAEVAPAPVLEPVPVTTAPITMRSPSIPDADEVRVKVEPAPVVVVDELRPPAPSVKERGRLATTVIACAAGLLVALAGFADVAAPVRLGLAGVAVAALVVRVALARRDAADAHALVASGPIAAAFGLAALAHAQGAAHEGAIALFAALAAAVAAATEEAIARAWREVEQARGGVQRALEEAARAAHAGEVLAFAAGETVAVDGAVASGEAVVIPWEGAPLEATKQEGDAVVAGARVVSGALRVTTAWSGVDRAWMRACTSPAARADVSAPIARFARLLLERGALGAAALVAVAAFVVGGGWIEALAAACAAAVAFGPRGVVAAVALVHARGQMRALAHGVTYKDARAFDRAGRAAVAVVCSRGTVLTGEPEIVALEGVGESRMSDTAILALAAGAETASTHPFAAAILRASRTRGVAPEAVRSTTVHAGLGVTALAASGDRLVVGSRALLLQEKVSVAVAEARASELEAQGRSVLLVALAGKLVGLVALQDGLRAGARAAVQRLLDARIEPVLLSGESRETCETIARALDIDHVRPEVLPADRGAEIRALAEGGHVVAVVGHAAGDDGALGAADVAVAMMAPRASEWAVSLASDDVRDAALAVSIPHAARDRARAALAVGIAPGAAASLALVFGVAPLVVAPLAMAAGVGAALVAARREA